MDRVQLAKDVIHNPIFQETFTEIREQLTTAWISTTAHDTDDREQLWLQIQLVDRVYNHLVAIFEEGTVYEHNINLKEI